MASSEDPRTGPAESGHVQIASGDGNTPQTALKIPSDALYNLEAITIGYDEGATATIQVDVYDEADGTGSGGVSDKRHVEKAIDPGEVVTVDFDGMRDFEEGVLVQEPNGAQDGDVEVTVNGQLLTSLKDVVAG